MIRKTNKESIAPYLIDASNYPRGNAEEVVIPETVDELIEFLKKARFPNSAFSLKLPMKI